VKFNNIMNIENFKLLFNNRILFTPNINSATFYTNIKKNDDIGIEYVDGFSLCCFDYGYKFTNGIKISGFNLFHNTSIENNFNNCKIETILKYKLTEKVISEYCKLFDDNLDKLFINSNFKFYSTNKNTYIIVDDVLYKLFHKYNDRQIINEWYKFKISNNENTAYSQYLETSIKIPKKLKNIDKQFIVDLFKNNFITMLNKILLIGD